MPRVDTRRRINALTKRMLSRGDSGLPIPLEEFEQRFQSVALQLEKRGIWGDSLTSEGGDHNSPERRMSNLELAAALYPWVLWSEARLGIRELTSREQRFVEAEHSAQEWAVVGSEMDDLKSVV